MFQCDEENIMRYDNDDVYLIHPEPKQTCFEVPFMKIADVLINGIREAECDFRFNSGFLQFLKLPFDLDDDDIITVKRG